MKHKNVLLKEILKQKFPQYTEKEHYSFIMCGEVKVGDETVRNKNAKVSPLMKITIAKKKWVSRGGEKLNHAIKKWNINCIDKVIIDAGSSTGGFTDVVLSYGASLVYAVDVGYNQLDYSLRKNSRVKVMEKTNIMSVNRLNPIPNFAVADLSFRSIKGAASHLLKQTSDNMLYALIKPQFEVEKSPKFNGVIKDKAILFNVLINLAESLQLEKVRIEDIILSPIRGGKGNIEFLCKMRSIQKEDYFSNVAVIKEFYRKQEQFITF